MKAIKIALIALIIPFTSQAGEAKVNWLDFNDYRDVFPSNESKKHYHKRVQKSFEKHLTKLMAKAPDGYKLNLTFNDIDLAGEVRFNINDIRVIKKLYFPRMKISYTLTDAQGKVLLSEENKVIKDLGFMDRIHVGSDSAFHYDKRLLTDWYKDEIKPTFK